MLLVFGIALGPGLHAQSSQSDRIVDPATTGGGPNAAAHVRSLRMHAKGYPWEHEIQVALPASYGEGQRSYPVLWVTDAHLNFDTAVKIVREADRADVPEMIVVGIGVPHQSLKEFQMRRVYDFSLPGMRGFKGPVSLR